MYISSRDLNYAEKFVISLKMMLNFAEIPPIFFVLFMSVSCKGSNEKRKKWKIFLFLMTMVEMIFSENRFYNRNMLNMNLHHSNNEQTFLKVARSVYD